MVIFFNFSLASNHLHPLQVENCDSNSRLVVDEDDYGKFRVKRVNMVDAYIPVGVLNSFFKAKILTEFGDTCICSSRTE